MMNTFAYLMLDGPGNPQFQLKLSVFLPIVTIVLAWLLIRREKRLFVIALIIALLSALIVTADAAHPITRGAMIEEFGPSYLVAIILSAGFPFLAIAVFYFEKVKSGSRSAKPNQAGGKSE